MLNIMDNLLIGEEIQAGSVRVRRASETIYYLIIGTTMMLLKRNSHKL